MFLIFLLVWVVLCGHVSVQTAVQGVLVSGLLTLFCYRVLGYSLSKDRFLLRHLGREVRYFAYLVKEIVHAALVIMRIIYTGGREMEPRLIYFHNELRTPAASSILAVIAILGVLLEEDFLVDIALVYALLSFLSVVILAKLVIDRRNRQLEREKREKGVHLNDECDSDHL